MPVSLTSLIQACREAFQAGDYPLVLELTPLLIRADPQRAEPWRVQAEAFVALERPHEAARAYAMAVERAPGDAALRVRQGRALARCGRHTEALAAHETAFALQPSLLSALHDLLAYRPMNPDDPALEAVRAMAAGAPSTPGARAFACFLLGRIHSQAGRDGEAFTWYAVANSLSHTALRQEPEPRGPGDLQHWWAPRLRQGQVLAKAGGSGSEACPAVLITGLPRSGKSLVEHLLTSHPALAPGGELGGLHEAVETCSGEPPQRLQQLRQLTSCGEGGPAHHYRQALAACGQPEARLIVDTTPPNLWDLGYLAALHPEVPLIFCRRDPLDLGAAIFFKRFRDGHAYSYDQRALGSMLALAEQAMTLWQRHLPNPIQLVDYDTLVADPIGERNRLLQGLGLDPGNCAAAQHGHRGPRSQAEPHQPLHPSHSADGYGGVIVTDLSGFARRFAGPLGTMCAAYRQNLEALQSAVGDAPKVPQSRECPTASAEGDH